MSCVGREASKSMSTEASPSAETGLQGHPEEYPLMNDGENRLMMRALRLGWEIPEQYRQALTRKLIETALHPDSTKRESTAATRVLAMFNNQNIQLTEFMSTNDTVTLPDAAEPEFRDRIDNMPLEDRLTLMRMFQAETDQPATVVEQTETNQTSETITE